jgi:hypothetical protein
MSDDRPSLRPRTPWGPVVLGRLSIAALVGVVVLLGLVRAGAIVIPARLNPFAPLHVSDSPNWLTRMKLARLQDDAPLCRAVLATSSVTFRTVPDRERDDGCGVTDAVEVTRSSVAFSGSFTATCPLAVAWALLETHVLQPAARRHLGQEVSRVLHLGTYACRNIDHRAGGRRSEHASANAIDISGFVLADGQRVTLVDAWDGPDARRAAFLRAVRDGACRFFDVVLGPDYNDAHRDHFHLDMGAYRACR